MKRTIADLRRHSPDASEADLARALEIVNAEPLSLEKRWEADDESRTAALAPRDRDGLTAAERQANAFADARGLAIPFPPR